MNVCITITITVTSFTITIYSITKIIRSYYNRMLLLYKRKIIVFHTQSIIMNILTLVVISYRQVILLPPTSESESLPSIISGMDRLRLPQNNIKGYFFWSNYCRLINISSFWESIIFMILKSIILDFLTLFRNP